MFRQRITLFNPTDSHDNIISHVDKQSLILKSPSEGLFVEHKTVVPPSAIAHQKYPLIRKVRVQIKHSEDIDQNPVFNYPSIRGVGIYLAPKEGIKSAEEREQFFELVGQLTEEILGLRLEKDNWVPVYGALYYHNIDSTISLDIASILKDQDPEKWLDPSASVIDLTYEKTGLTIKHASKITGDLIVKSEPGVSKEIGLFLLDNQVTSPDDLMLSGLRVILNESDDSDQNLFKTMFHVKPRHRHFPDQIQTSFKPNGLHPILHSSFLNGTPIPTDDDVTECRMYYYLQLEKSLIFDKYQSIPVGSDLVINTGKTELEAPEYSVKEWGNELLLEFDDFVTTEIDFTFHSRYLRPQEGVKSTTVYNSLPEIFVACEVSDSHLLETSPFDNRGDIGGSYEQYFTNGTVFYHFNHTSTYPDKGLLQVDIPHGTSNFAHIHKLTSIAVIFGFALIAYKLLSVALRRVSTPEKKKTE